MAKPQPRLRGVRQRKWGSWVSEIRHSSSKVRIWLGTYKTAEHAAKVYDEAARLMFGPAATTNFPCPSQSMGFQYLSDPLIAKLRRINLEAEKSSAMDVPRGAGVSINGGKVEMEFVGEVEKSELTEDHIEEMIEELLDPEVSIEICSTAIP